MKVSVNFLYAILALSLGTSTVFAFSSRDKVLVIGATGGTGKQVLQGLVDSGLKPNNLRVLSRNASKLQKLQEEGFGTVQADLNDSNSLAQALEGCQGCYLHSTIGDTKELDTNEVSMANHLAAAIASQERSVHVVYNSAAGEEGVMGARRLQKRAVETLFREKYPSIDFTGLRPFLFMEELWKVYTRPGILDGKFTFCVPPDTPISLTSVADMGYMAGKCIQSTKTTKNRIFNVAGDSLTPVEIAATFATVQGSPCVHKKATLMAIMARLFFKSLWEDIAFLRNTKVVADIDVLKQEFGAVTSFEEFLTKSGWADTSKTYEDLSKTF